MIMLRPFAACVLLVCASLVAAAEGGFTFDAAEFAKKPFEFGGYLEYKHDYFRLNRGGAFYGLNFRGDTSRGNLDRDTGTAKLQGSYTRGAGSLRARLHADVSGDQLGGDQGRRIEELVGAWKPGPGFAFEVGKMSQKWGKGYAWNPVAFVERTKDPNDPDLAREGFWMMSADWTRTFEGPLQTVTFTPLLVPGAGDLNADFGRKGHLNAAAKLYLLYRDTDIDFMFLGGGSRPNRFGMDFARNITPAFAVHGEWARVRNVDRRVVSAAGAGRVERSHADSYVLGARYLTANETTFIMEYYRNGAGYSEPELQDFFRLVDNGLTQLATTGTETLLQRAAAAAQGGYGRPQAMQKYLYFRASHKEPFDILYFTPAVTAIVALQDGSFSLSPEMLYTGITNVELRARFFFLQGGGYTDFGEKQNRRRLELQARLYF